VSASRGSTVHHSEGAVIGGDGRYQIVCLDVTEQGEYLYDGRTG